MIDDILRILRDTHPLTLLAEFLTIAGFFAAVVFGVAMAGAAWGLM